MVSRKYVNDYGLENVRGKNGRVKTVSVYKGPWFRFTAKPEELKKSRSICIAASLAGTAAMLPPLFIKAEILGAVYVLLPLLCCLWPIAFELMGVYRLLTAAERVTREHKDKIYARFSSCCVFQGIFAFFSLAGQIVFYVLNDGGGAGDYAVSVCTALELMMAGLIFINKNKLMMEQVPS